jgi:hypothetical protein
LGFLVQYMDEDVRICINERDKWEV